MLFCNIELKIYVPDGFEDFMVALSDPRAFMGAQQKQNEQMTQMGIEVTDSSKSGDKDKKDDKKEEAPLVFDPITLESIQMEKVFLKSMKKYQKELESTRKKQLKEKLALNKSQCSVIEKLTKSKRYVKILSEILRAYRNFDIILAP